MCNLGAVSKKSLRSAVRFAQKSGKHKTQVIDCSLCCESSSFTNCEFWIFSRILVLPLPVSEASCVSQIRTAAAFSEDIGAEHAASIGVGQWAACGERNSERDVHRVLKKQRDQIGYTAGCDVL